MASLLRTRHLSPRTFALLRSPRSSRTSSNLLAASSPTAAATAASPVSRAGFHHAARRRQQPSVFQTQLEDPAAASAFESLRATAAAPKQTLTEKIVQKFAVGLPAGQYVKSGDYVSVQPQHCMSHDNTWPIAKKFMSMGATSIKDSKQIVMTLDHDVQNKSEANLKKYSLIEEFAAKHGVNFYPAGRGIGHQIMCESGYVQPGTMVVASDSHSNMYGGLGALGTAVVRTDAASIWSTGRTWYQVPPVAKVNFTGVLPEGVTGKDVIVALCGLFNRDEVLNHAIEFAGSEETLRSLQIDDRLAIANMTTEFGALAGVFPVDSVLLGWLRFKATEAAMWGTEPGRTGDDTRFTHESVEELASNPLVADSGAKYAKELYLNLSTLSPYVAGPNSVKVATPVSELEPQQIKINKAYLVSCTNSRASDIAAAAKVFKDAAEKNDGKIPKISNGVEFYIAAASAREQKTAEEQGDWQALLDAGARELPSGCGPCIGLGTGLLQPDEVGISASNRNFKARMGSADAKAYLASPEVVAASALSGVISGPGRYQQPEGWTGVEYGEGDGIKEGERMVTAEEALDRLIGQIDGLLEKTEAEASTEEAASEEDDSALVSILPGFPEKIEGEIVFVDNDAINTDGIYPGRLTYNDDVSKEQMAEACMSNYDPAFQTIAKPGDVLVSGFSFGVGSSREQAATSILAKGIPLVVAGSFSNIFSRNSINNGLPSLEVPKLVERLREAFPSSEPPAGQAQQEVKEPSLNKESLDSPPPAPPKQHNSKVLTRRTGWRLTWDVRRSKVVIDEGNGKRAWSAKVGTLPENVQEIIAKGGLENWVKAQIGAQ